MENILNFDSFCESITIPVEIGDTVWMGKFKNKKTIIKEIGVDDKGMPTINNKKVVTFRTTPPKKTKFTGVPFWKKFRKSKK